MTIQSDRTPHSIPEERWNAPGGYRFLVQVTQDDEGLFSAVALNLPGTGSSGSTAEQAVERFKEAAAGMIESYLASGESIPWKTLESAEIPPGSQWISVNA